MKNNTLGPVQKLTFAAMLLSMSIVMTLLAKTVPMGAFYYVRFSLTPSLIVFTSLALGPFYGMLVGAFSDLIPAFLYPTGQYNFLITIVYCVLGLLPWFLEMFTRRFRSALRKPYAFYAALALIFLAVTFFFYGTDLLNDSFGAAAPWAKPTILGVTALLDIGLCVALYQWNRHYEKKILEYSDIPSPNEIAFISLITETVVMDALKALAFWGFYNFLADESFPLSYGLVFSMLFMVSSINIMIMTFATSWMLIFTKNYIRPLIARDK